MASVPVKSNVNCCVVGCYNKYSNMPENIQMFRFPSEKKFHQQFSSWVTAVKRKNKDGSPWKPTRHTRICSEHFIGNTKSTNPNSPSYVPTIFPKVYGKRKKNVEAITNRYDRYKKRCTSTGVFDNEDCHLPCEAAVATENSEEDCHLLFTYDSANTEKILQCEVGTQVYFEIPLLNKGPNYLFCSHISSCDVATQTVLYQATELPRNEADKSLHYENKTKKPDMKSVACGPNVTTEDIPTRGFKGFCSVREEPQALKDLAGVCTTVFMMLLSLIQKPTCTGPWRLTAEDRLLLALMKLKHGLTFSSLAVLFGIHCTSASRIFFAVLTVLNKKTKHLIFWPSRETIKRTMPMTFQTNFPMCRAIIDCTEIRTEIPHTIEQQVLFYSKYKGAHTVKFLVACTPNGMICFCSPCYGGRASDAFITVNSGFVNYIEPGDVVLADKGFPHIASVLSDHRAVLVMPSFSEGNAQFSEEQVKHTYSVASVRIHVERCIQRIKCYRILDKVYAELLPHVDKIVQLCCVLANMGPPLIKEK